MALFFGNNEKEKKKNIQKIQYEMIRYDKPLIPLRLHHMANNETNP